MVFGLNSVYTTHQRLMALSPAEAKEPLSETLKKAGKKALGGGVAGAVAMFVNVGTLMWMRTTVNYQYRYGMGTFEAIGPLYKEGGGGLSGIRRFYRGVGPALFQGPLSRFGDTASNAGMLALWDSLEFTKELPMWTKSVSASLAAAKGAAGASSSRWMTSPSPSPRRWSKSDPNSRPETFGIKPPT